MTLRQKLPEGHRQHLVIILGIQNQSDATGAPSSSAPCRLTTSGPNTFFCKNIRLKRIYRHTVLVKVSHSARLHLSLVCLNSSNRTYWMVQRWILLKKASHVSSNGASFYWRVLRCFYNLFLCTRRWRVLCLLQHLCPCTRLWRVICCFYTCAFVQHSMARVSLLLHAP